MPETSGVYMLRVESMQAGVSHRFVSYDPVNLEDQGTVDRVAEYVAQQFPGINAPDWNLYLDEIISMEELCQVDGTIGILPTSSCLVLEMPTQSVRSPVVCAPQSQPSQLVSQMNNLSPFRDQLAHDSGSLNSPVRKKGKMEASRTDDTPKSRKSLSFPALADPESPTIIVREGHTDEGVIGGLQADADLFELKSYLNLVGAAFGLIDSDAVLHVTPFMEGHATVKFASVGIAEAMVKEDLTFGNQTISLILKANVRKECGEPTNTVTAHNVKKFYPDHFQVNLQEHMNDHCGKCADLDPEKIVCTQRKMEENVYEVKFPSVEFAQHLCSLDDMFRYEGSDVEFEMVWIPMSKRVESEKATATVTGLKYFFSAHFIDKLAQFLTDSNIGTVDANDLAVKVLKKAEHTHYIEVVFPTTVINSRVCGLAEKQRFRYEGKPAMQFNMVWLPPQQAPPDTCKAAVTGSLKFYDGHFQDKLSDFLKDKFMCAVAAEELKVKAGRAPDGKFDIDIQFPTTASNKLMCELKGEDRFCYEGSPLSFRMVHGEEGVLTLAVQNQLQDDTDEVGSTLSISTLNGVEPTMAFLEECMDCKGVAPKFIGTDTALRTVRDNLKKNYNIQVTLEDCQRKKKLLDGNHRRAPDPTFGPYMAYLRGESVHRPRKIPNTLCIREPAKTTASVPCSHDAVLTGFTKGAKMPPQGLAALIDIWHDFKEEYDGIRTDSNFYRKMSAQLVLRGHTFGPDYVKGKVEELAANFRAYTLSLNRTGKGRPKPWDLYEPLRPILEGSVSTTAQQTFAAGAASGSTRNLLLVHDDDGAGDRHNRARPPPPRVPTEKKSEKETLVEKLCSSRNDFTKTLGEVATAINNLSQKVRTRDSN